MVMNHRFHVRTGTIDFAVNEALQIRRARVAFLRVAIQVESHDVGGGNARGRQTSRQEETGVRRRHPDADVPKAVDDAVTGQYAVGDNQFLDELAISRKLHVSSSLRDAPAYVVIRVFV